MDVRLKFDRDATDTIKGLLSRADRAKIAVAYWGLGSSALFANFDADISIICNLDSGACCPAEIRKLIAEHGSDRVRNHPFLHAKVYWTDRGALLGSSNVSTNGLALGQAEAAALREANVFLPTALKNELEAWFDARFSEAQPISEDALTAAEQEWKRRRAIRHTATNLPVRPGATLREATAEDPEFFQDKPIFIVLSTKDLSTQEKSLRNEVRILEKDASLETYSNWNIKPGSFVLDFWSANGRIEFCGLWKIPEAEERWEYENDNARVVLCRQVERYASFQAPGTNEAEEWERWLQNISDAAAHDPAAKSMLQDLLGSREPLSLFDFGARAQSWTTRAQLEAILKNWDDSRYERGSLEHDFWRTIEIFEKILKRKRGKTVRLQRTHQKAGRVGVLQTLIDWATQKKNTDGFSMLLNERRPDLTGEAIVLRHPKQFTTAVRLSARAKLEHAGIDVSTLPTQYPYEEGRW